MRIIRALSLGAHNQQIVRQQTKHASEAQISDLGFDRHHFPEIASLAVDAR